MDSNSIITFEEYIKEEKLPFGIDVTSDEIENIYFHLEKAAGTLTSKERESYTEDDMYLLMLILGISTSSVSTTVIDAITKPMNAQAKYIFAQDLCSGITQRIQISEDSICKVLLHAWPKCKWLLTTLTYAEIKDSTNEKTLEMIEELKGLMGRELETRVNVITKEALKNGI